ncbi:hypothetical protein [Aestuariimicrobium sp. Y1814]|uniref:hypothetical protein n=1 Tax=Aestuariimicrobium sp. Y1814 TaxID=3418742 RepID=UPI003DA6DBAA
MRPSFPTVVLLVVSMVAAGLLGQFRDSAMDDFQKHGELGRVTEMDAGQTIQPLEQSFGQFAVSPSGSNSLQSPVRLVSLRFEFTTPGRKDLHGVRCFLRLSGDTIAEALEDDALRFPAPGFRSTGTVLFEVTRENLVGAKVACVPTGVIVYREPELLMDLGVTSRNIESIWTNSAFKRVNWSESSEEALP